MGRETKFLLALLGLLAGVFLGVVSMKLFVPRPPAGAGPDVHADIATAEAQALVEPPELSPATAPADAIAMAPPDVPPATAAPDQLEPPVRSSRFGGDAPPQVPPDPFVGVASFESAEPPPAPPASTAPPADLLPPVDPVSPANQVAEADLLPPPSFARAAPQPPPHDGPAPAPAIRESVPPSSFEPALAASPATPLGEAYVARAGDSWWSLAERAYGDGRFYRALFAWNRMIDPRVSLAPGTRLEIPPAAKLGASWPGLLPRD